MGAASSDPTPMNPRQIGIPAALVVLGYLLSLAAASPSLQNIVPQLFTGLGLVAGVAVLVAAGNQKGPALGPLVEALRSAARGKRPRIP